MDFRLTTEQTDIKQAATDFAKGEFDPDAALEYDKEQKFPLSIWKKASKLGFIGVNFPEQYGGQDCGLLEYVLIAESFCQQDSGIGIALVLSDFGSGMILRYGNETQKRIILPIVAQGKGIATLAFLEEGCTLSPFETYAKINKNRYTINGEKSFVALGELATYIIIVCQTGLDNPRAQSVILVEGKMNGITVASMGEKLGMRMIPL